jgi:hypothetical protein
MRVLEHDPETPPDGPAGFPCPGREPVDGHLPFRGEKEAVQRPRERALP